jgi:predicted site-specific integrase-resolvase
MLYRVSTKTIRRWEADGKIRSVRTEGGLLYISSMFNVSELLGNRLDTNLTLAYARVSSNYQKKI